MDNMGISTDPAMLGVALTDTLTESPSVTTFLPEEDASTCPLLPETPSPPPMAFSHPLTPSAGDDDIDSNNSMTCEDQDTKVVEETSSSGSSSGIVMDVTDTATASLFNKHAYQHLGNGKTHINQENTIQENGIKQNGLLDIQITKNTPCFVSWNWPLIRKCTFFVFMSSLLAMCAIVIAMIVTLPKTCNPKTAWYRGGVFYEIFPASFQDSNDDGLGDLRGIINRLDYLENMGITAVRLNSIFPSTHYPDHYENVTSLTNVDNVLGTISDLSQLAFRLHARNMSLVLDLPIYPYVKQLEVVESKPVLNETVSENLQINTKTVSSSTTQKVNHITEAIRNWLSKGVDGFYIKGLEHFQNDPYLVKNIAEWKYTLGQDRVLIVSEALFENLDSNLIKEILPLVDLVEIHLHVLNGTTFLSQHINLITSGIFAPHIQGPWIQWSLGGVTKQRLSRYLSPNETMAATIMQLMLPGTPNIFYGDEISLEESHDPRNDHEETKHLHHLSTMAWNDTIQFTNPKHLPWLPRGASVSFENYDKITNMIKIRDQAPAIYKNGIFKEDQSLPNTNVRHSKDDILIIERTYPRRNTFVSISNFGTKPVGMDLTSLFYCGQIVLGSRRGEKVYFGEFQIGPQKTIVVKIDK